MPIPASPVSKSTHPKPAARAKGRRPTPLRGLGICALALLGLASAGLAQAADTKAKKPTMQQVLESSKPADWRALDPASTLYMELPGGRVVIELATQFAPLHAANIRTLVKQKYFDGLAILRVQDNFVTQWGDPDADDATKARSFGAASKSLAAEFSRPAQGLAFTRLPAGDAMVTIDGLADQVGPGSTVGAATITNMLKCRIAEKLTQLGQPPLVLSSSYFLGSEKAAQRFDDCYDEYRRRMVKVYGG